MKNWLILVSVFLLSIKWLEINFLKFFIIYGLINDQPLTLKTNNYNTEANKFLSLWYLSSQFSRSYHVIRLLCYVYNEKLFVFQKGNTCQFVVARGRKVLCTHFVPIPKAKCTNHRLYALFHSLTFVQSNHSTPTLAFHSHFFFLGISFD